MSLTWITAVFAAPEPSGTDRLVLLALADHANASGECWPSLELLRRKCGLRTRRAIEKALTRVERWSATAPATCVRVEVERRSGRVNRYRLLIGRGVREVGASPEPAAAPSRPGRRGRPSARTDKPSTPPTYNPQQGPPGAGSRLVAALVRFGVEHGVAASLVARYPTRVGPALVRFQSDGGLRVHTPGWLVHAIRSGWVERLDARTGTPYPRSVGDGA